MAKLTITPSTVAVDNVSNLENQVRGQAATVKLAMDQYGIDDKTYTNDVLIAELNGNSGSYKIGHNSNSINSDNVGDALEENRQLINTLELSETENVKITGNQTISGTKTFSSNVVVPVTPTSTTHATSKDYVDTGLDTKADDDSVVKLTGNQSVSGVKTFSSLPVITSQPSTSTQAANKAYVDSVTAGVILGQIPDNSLTDDKLVDKGGIKSAVYDSFYIGPSDVIGNVKKVVEFETTALAIGTYVTTNAKIGTYSARGTYDGTNSVVLQNFTSVNVSKLNDGTDVVTDNSFLCVPITVEGTVPVRFGVELRTLGGTNYFICNNVSIVPGHSGFKVLKIPMSAFTVIGAATLSNITSFRMYSLSGDATTVIYVDDIYFVKADPEDPSKPNPFQINGKRIFDNNYGEFAVFYEFGKAKWRDFKGAGAFGSLVGQAEYSDSFVATFSVKQLPTNVTPQYGLQSDSGNSRVSISGGTSNRARIYIVSGGVVVVDDYISGFDHFSNQSLNFTIKRNGNFLILTAQNKDTGVTIERSYEITGLTPMKLNIGTDSSSRESEVLSVSITQIPHAHTSDISDLAINAVNSEAVGEVGIDNIVEYNPLLPVEDINNNTTLKAQFFTVRDVDAFSIGLPQLWRHGINLHHSNLNGFNAQRLCTLNANAAGRNYAQHWRQGYGAGWSEWFQELQTGKMFPVSAFTHVGVEGNRLNWTNPVSGQFLKTQIFRCETTDKMTGKASEILSATSGVTLVYNSAGTGSGGANTFVDTYVPAEGTLLFYVIVALFEIGGATWYSPRKTLSYNYITPTGYYLHEVGAKAGSWTDVVSASTDYVEDSQVSSGGHTLVNLESVDYSLYDTVEFEAIRVSGTQSFIQFKFGDGTSETPLQLENSADFSSWHLVTIDISALTATGNGTLTQATGSGITVTYRYRNIRLYNA